MRASHPDEKVRLLIVGGDGRVADLGEDLRTKSPELLFVNNQVFGAQV
jgi:hypothetical protein